MVDITDLGRVLTAMAVAIEDDRLKRMFHAGAAKCAEIAQEQLADDDWIDWGGGECPVPPETIVEVEFSNGTFAKERAYALDWQPMSVFQCDIKRYRIIDKPEQTG